MDDKKTYMDILSTICEKYSDNEIDEDQAVALVEKANERYLSESDHDDDDSYTSESYDNEEYNKVVDAICEKFNEDEIDAPQAIALMERAVDRYL